MFPAIRCLCLLLPALLIGANVASQQAQANWPQANGPTGNFTPLTSGVRLLDDISRARQLWLSEDADLGYGKGSASGYVQNLARWPGHPGSSSGPIVADTRLFVTSFRPAGEPWAEKLPQFKNLDTQQKPFTEDESRRMRQNLRILADDLTVAIDITNGKTVWKAVEAEQGLNRYMGKRQGFCVSPAHYQGVVFSMGTTGLLYAYDAATGNKLWQADIGPAHHKAVEYKQKVLAQQTLPGGMGWDVSLVVAGGILIVPMFDGVDVGLRGVDTRTGKTLWEVAKACSRHATPAVWACENRQYILAATVAGTLSLIEPATGKLLWTVDGLGENHFSLTPTDTHVFVNGGSSTLRKEGDTHKYGLLAAYQLSPQQAKLAWKHPDEPDLYFPTWMDSCARRFLAVGQGRVYYQAHGRDKASQRRCLMLDETTGKILAEFPIDSSGMHLYPAEDRLLAIRDAAHSETPLAMITTNPQDFRPLTGFWNPPHLQTTAYEVFMEHPIVDGRIYLRTKDGRIACYDLRRE